MAAPVMSTSRKVTVEFLGVFLIGALAGGLVMWGVTDRELSKFMNKLNDPDSVIVDRMNKKYSQDYHLTQEEMQRIQPLLKELAHNISQTRHQFGMDILATMSDSHRKIAAQLSPEHRAYYEQKIARREKDISALLLVDPATVQSATPAPAAQGQH